MVTAAMEIFFCWLDLNNIWLLGCSTLPARLGWILRPAPRYRAATTSSVGCLRAGPGASHTQGFPPGSPRAHGLVSRRRGGGKKVEGGKKGRGGGRHLLLIAHSCGQAAPISAARNCSRQGTHWGERSCSSRRAPEQEKPLAGRRTLLHPSTGSA